MFKGNVYIGQYDGELERCHHIPYFKNFDEELERVLKEKTFSMYITDNSFDEQIMLEIESKHDFNYNGNYQNYNPDIDTLSKCIEMFNFVGNKTDEEKMLDSISVINKIKNIKNNIKEDVKIICVRLDSYCFQKYTPDF